MSVLIKPVSQFINLLPEQISERSDSSKLSCKFVIIRHQDQLVLVLGNVAEYPYHANLVYHFCQQNEIAAEWEKKPDLVTIFESKTMVQGGGWIEIVPKSRMMRIFGKSTAYGEFDINELNHIVESEPFFSEFNIEFNS